MRTPFPTQITALPPEYRSPLMEHARDVSFPEGERLFSEGGHADRFWIIRSGAVAMDLHVPGRQPAVIENLGPGELVGWSWMFKPYRWHMGARATTPVRTHEFDALTVRMLMDADAAFGSVVGHWVSQVLAHRLQATRVRLLGLYAPYGSGSVV
ncbi:cyclic nucleotide-binding domain-containing protein [Streptomyces sp. NPDC058287]|uniref:cyclic nucleotide-binding domain-containing protein n=1 Tax=unclassified Streptomyces TaxID=2593676 RepID=UPI0036EB4259